MNIDFNILYALLIAAGVVVFVRVIKPYLNKNNIDFYEEVKLFLLISGFAFRDDKIKAISATTLEVVKNMEQLSLTADEKHYLAIDEVFRRLLDEFNLEIDETVIEAIIRIAVSQLPPTNKPELVN